MKPILTIIFLLFSYFSIQVQAQVLIDYDAYLNMDKFDWLAFSNKENIQERIDLDNYIFEQLGPGINTIGNVNTGKSDLIRLEQELGLYKGGIKEGLSEEMIQSAEEAIELHWGNINSIENQIKVRAGLGEVMEIAPQVEKTEDYYNGFWELYKGDYDILFNMVEKKDEALYEALGSDDEAYAGFIAPYMERYMGKLRETAGAYYGSFQSPEVDVDVKRTDADNLFGMYKDSIEIYSCFLKNFKEPVGINQQRLKGSIYDWHTDQALFGLNSTRESYKTFGIETEPGTVAYSFYEYYDAPIEVRENIGRFLRNDILKNEEFINTEERLKLKARVDSLIGLNYLGVATPEEQELYNKSIEQGIIKYISTHSFYGRPLPLPRPLPE